MALVESSSCLIDKINSDGLGEGKTSIGKIELPYVLPGELVEFERHKYRSQESFLLKKIINESPNRVVSACKYFGYCGGCSLQHMNESSYLEFKLQLLNKIQIENIEIISPQNSKRRRFSLFFLKKNGSILLGYKKLKSELIVNIDSCIAAENIISDLIQSVREFLEKILDDGERGEVYFLLADNGIALRIDLNTNNILKLNFQSKLNNFAKKNNIISVDLYANKNLISKYSLEDSYILNAGYRVK